MSLGGRYSYRTVLCDKNNVPYSENALLSSIANYSTVHFHFLVKLIIISVIYG